MPHIMQQYNSIKKTLDRLTLYTERNNNNKKNLHEYLTDLHNIACEMIEFKNNGGKICFSYGHEPLITHFAKHVWKEDLTVETKKIYDDFLNKLDKKKNLSAYKIVSEEYYLYINQKNLQNHKPKINIIDDYNPKTEEFKPKKDLYVEHIVISRQKTSKQTCRIS